MGNRCYKLLYPNLRIIRLCIFLHIKTRYSQWNIQQDIFVHQYIVMSMDRRQDFLYNQSMKHMTWYHCQRSNLANRLQYTIWFVDQQKSCYWKGMLIHIFLSSNLQTQPDTLCSIAYQLHMQISLIHTLSGTFLWYCFRSTMGCLDILFMTKMLLDTHLKVVGSAKVPKVQWWTHFLVDS